MFPQVGEPAVVLRRTSLFCQPVPMISCGPHGGQAQGNEGGALASVEKRAEGSKELSMLAASASAVIDDIAYQTSILALNAAVEAARAAPHGRDFAVVASEVQTLSRRSASAAKEIQHLINGSVQQVGLGATLTDAAGNAMDDIVTRIARVNDIMRGLDAATQQEAVWFDAIVASISKLDQAAASNTGLVQSFSVQTEQMQEQVHNFLHGDHSEACRR